MKTILSHLALPRPWPAALFYGLVVGLCVAGIPAALTLILNHIPYLP